MLMQNVQITTALRPLRVEISDLAFGEWVVHQLCCPGAYRDLFAPALPTVFMVPFISGSADCPSNLSSWIRQPRASGPPKSWLGFGMWKCLAVASPHSDKTPHAMLSAPELFPAVSTSPSLGSAPWGFIKTETCGKMGNTKPALFNLGCTPSPSPKPRSLHPRQ